jgi:hypothetical protein
MVSWHADAAARGEKRGFGILIRNIEMVRGLIEQEQVWFLQEHARQCRHVFLSAAELWYRFV